MLGDFEGQHQIVSLCCCEWLLEICRMEIDRRVYETLAFDPRTIQPYHFLHAKFVTGRQPGASAASEIYDTVRLPACEQITHEQPRCSQTAVAVLMIKLFFVVGCLHPSNSCRFSRRD